jgi:hypothetical protein
MIIIPEQGKLSSTRVGSFSKVVHLEIRFTTKKFPKQFKISLFVQINEQKIVQIIGYLLYKCFR